VDVDSETALMLAIYKGFVPAIHILLEAGADIEASESKYFTALILAVILADVSVVSILLQAGANIEKAGDSRRTDTSHVGCLPWRQFCH
jgi:ankyrin repeat protein